MLLTEKSTYQNEWPVGRIVKAYPNSDNRVRKVDVRVDSDRRTFTRPTSVIVLLCRKIVKVNEHVLGFFAYICN